MRCHEVRTFIGPYLDSELDAKTSCEIEQHLENCADCARCFEAEEKVDARILPALRAGTRTAAIWEAAESRIHPLGAIVRLKRLWPLAAAAAIVLAMGLALWTHSRKVDLAEAIEHCHDAYVRKVTSPEFKGPVPAELAGKLGGRLDPAAFAYRPASAAFSAQGARLCYVENVPVALILGDYREVPVSLVVMKSAELEHFPGIKKRFEKGHSVVCSRSGRYQFAARVVDGHVVCIVGDAPSPSLEALVKTVAKRS